MFQDLFVQEAILITSAWAGGRTRLISGMAPSGRDEEGSWQRVLPMPSAGIPLWAMSESCRPNSALLLVSARVSLAAASVHHLSCYPPWTQMRS